MAFAADVLTAEEFRTLLAGLPDRERLMGMIGATTGMRIGEALGLKWQDIRFDTCEADVLRSFSDGPSVPARRRSLSSRCLLTTSSLRGWRLGHPVCGYPKPDDWIFASDYNFGKTPLWPDSLRTKVLQPTARRVGIKKQIGWHTFRRTYSSVAATGDDVKVVHRKPKHSSRERGIRVGPEKPLLPLEISPKLLK
jgi:integrase